MSLLRRQSLRERFKDHEVRNHFQQNDDESVIEFLRFAKPDSSIDSMSYILHSCNQAVNLFVSGDLFEATYQWYGAPKNLKWVSTCSLDYFHGKCKASPSGILWNVWCEKAAKENIKGYLEEDEDDALKRFKASDGPKYLHDKDEWYRWLEREGSEVLGDYFWEWAGGVGFVMSPYCEFHLYGLQKAFQLIDKKEKRTEVIKVGK